MKDAIIEAIHRHRTEQARRFNYDVHAIGEDIRRREAGTGGKLVGLKRTPSQMAKPGKTAATAKGKALAGK